MLFSRPLAPEESSHAALEDPFICVLPLICSRATLWTHETCQALVFALSCFIPLSLPPSLTPSLSSHGVVMEARVEFASV